MVLAAEKFKFRWLHLMRSFLLVQSPSMARIPHGKTEHHAEKTHFYNKATASRTHETKSGLTHHEARNPTPQSPLPAHHWMPCLHVTDGAY